MSHTVVSESIAVGDVRQQPMQQVVAHVSVHSSSSSSSSSIMQRQQQARSVHINRNSYRNVQVPVSIPTKHSSSFDIITIQPLPTSITFLQPLSVSLLAFWLGGVRC
jgi:hypothetical protein